VGRKHTTTGCGFVHVALLPTAIYKSNLIIGWSQFFLPGCWICHDLERPAQIYSIHVYELSIFQNVLKPKMSNIATHPKIECKLKNSTIMGQTDPPNWSTKIGPKLSKTRNPTTGVETSNDTTNPTSNLTRSNNSSNHILSSRRSYKWPEAQNLEWELWSVSALNTNSYNVQHEKRCTEPSDTT